MNSYVRHMKEFPWDASSSKKRATTPPLITVDHLCNCDGLGKIVIWIEHDPIRYYSTWLDVLEMEVPDAAAAAAAAPEEMAGCEYIMSDLMGGKTWWADDTGCFMSMATRASDARESSPWSLRLPKMSL